MLAATNELDRVEHHLQRQPHVEPGEEQANQGHGDGLGAEAAACEGAWGHGGVPEGGPHQRTASE